MTLMQNHSKVNDKFKFDKLYLLFNILNLFLNLKYYLKFLLTVLN